MAVLLGVTPHPKRIKLRIMGAENEIGERFLCSGEANSLLLTKMESGDYTRSLARCALPDSMQYRLRAKYATLLNQGQVYTDVNAQIEYATPECIGGLQLALFETAGLGILAHALKKFNTMWTDLPPLKFYKTNRNSSIEKNALSQTSWGSHASYLTLRRVPLSELGVLWKPFVQTRYGVIGNGWIDFFDGEYVHFLFSQRADILDDLKNELTTGVIKPIVHTKDQPLANGDIWRRFHDISGNANMSQIQLALKYGTADIVLAMIEAEGFLRPPPCFKLSYGSRTILGYFNADIRGRVALLCEDGTKKTALDVQEFYLEEAHRFFKEGRGTLTEERKWILELWTDVVCALRRWDLEYMSHILDWAAILYHIQILFGRLNLDFDAFCDVQEEDGFIRYPMENPVSAFVPVPRKSGRTEKLLDYLLHFIVQYADVETDSSPYGVMVRHGVMKTLFSPEEILYAETHPPSRTRAHLREEIEKHIRPDQRITESPWNSMTIAFTNVPETREAFTVALPNPYRSRIGKEEEWFLGEISCDGVHESPSH